MIIGYRHTGLVVRDLERSIKFYIRLGFELRRRQFEEGSYIESVTGIDGLSLEWAKLKGADGALIELLQYHSHPDENNIENMPNRLGCSHVSFTVDSIEKTCDLIKEMGGVIINSPVESPDGGVKVVYCHDFDGVMIELVEER
ncbi:MAG: glyoxalase [Nitrosomonadaceae bacterium]|nr:glyoxalase [Nitrosomonadaceae bacterium]|tara:strand:+ start:108 stop:536 length:429 start_codon:yes stop_codon:yes gene_type:complete